MKLHRKARRGFTLIELLVVIGIVVILSVVVVLTLNPAQLLAQARDSTRISDAATIKSAISLYLSDVSSTDMDGTPNTLCSVASSSLITSAVPCSNRFAGSGAFFYTTSTGAQIATDGSGWIPLNFNGISAGSPISALPTDPVNNTAYYYAYRGSSATSSPVFEMNMLLESTKYAAAGGPGATDGGNATSTAMYEVGNDPGLDL